MTGGPSEVRLRATFSVKYCGFLLLINNLSRLVARYVTYMPVFCQMQFQQGSYTPSLFFEVQGAWSLIGGQKQY